MSVYEVAFISFLVTAGMFCVFVIGLILILVSFCRKEKPMRPEDDELWPEFVKEWRLLGNGEIKSSDNWESSWMLFLAGAKAQQRKYAAEACGEKKDW